MNIYDSQYKIETPEARTKFINSVVRLLNEYDFDGVDLGWQFPPVKVAKSRGTFGKIWHGIKKTFGYGKFKDEKEQEHRDGFTNLVRDLKAQLRARNKALTLSVLPHINGTGKLLIFVAQFNNYILSIFNYFFCICHDDSQYTMMQDY